MNPASWLDGLTRNWADLMGGDPDPRLRPVPLRQPPREAVAWAIPLIAALPRWRVESSDPAAGTIHAVHVTGLWRFRDDIRIRFEPDGAGSIVHAHSQSRLGKGDLGQNARNLRELTDALREADAS